MNGATNGRPHPQSKGGHARIAAPALDDLDPVARAQREEERRNQQAVQQVSDELVVGSPALLRQFQPRLQRVHLATLDERVEGEAVQVHDPFWDGACPEQVGRRFVARARHAADPAEAHQHAQRRLHVSRVGRALAAHVTGVERPHPLDAQQTAPRAERVDHRDRGQAMRVSVQCFQHENPEGTFESTDWERQRGRRPGALTSGRRQWPTSHRPNVEGRRPGRRPPVAMWRSPDGGVLSLLAVRKSACRPGLHLAKPDLRQHQKSYPRHR
jgi:hypothetical protein